MATWDISALRTILSTETDANSPGSEELLGQMRENWEALVLLLLGTGITGTVTTIAETILTDSGQAYTVDLHINHTLLITSGDANGNMYTIDDNAATTLTLTGDTLVTDGVSEGDTFAILYDMKINADGHDHDGDNSAEAVVSKGRVNVFSHAADEHEYTHTGNTDWTTKIVFRLYIPATANTLYATYRIKNNTHTGYARLSEAAAGQSGGVQRAVNSYAWVSEDSLDVSGVAEGWVDLSIQIKTSDGGATTSIAGLTISWGPA